MCPVADDPYLELAPLYALGALDADERAGLEAHLASGCAACEAEVGRQRALAAALPKGLAPAPIDGRLREQILDLSEAPELPADLWAIAWSEVAPGIRIHVVKEDPARGLRACLVWAQPGARHGLHRHKGDENILVLKGGLRDHRGTYHRGEVCRSRAGSAHAEEALADEECVCYVTYYGDLEMLEA